MNNHMVRFKARGGIWNLDLGEGPCAGIHPEDRDGVRIDVRAIERLPIWVNRDCMRSTAGSSEVGLERAHWRDSSQGAVCADRKDFDKVQVADKQETVRRVHSERSR